MVKSRLIVVLGDQLSADISSLRMADKERDVVIMAEVMAEATYVPHHPKKIALVLAAMRKFSVALREDGWTVAYSKLDDEANTGSIQGELVRRASEFGADEIIATTPGEWRLIAALNDLPLVDTALERNPTPPYWHLFAAGMARYFDGDFEAAEPFLVAARDKNPTAPFPHRYLIATYGMLRQSDDAEWAAIEYEALGRNASVQAMVTEGSIVDDAYREKFAEGLRAAGLPEN
jgi:hypothetical protein